MNRQQLVSGSERQHAQRCGISPAEVLFLVGSERPGTLVALFLKQVAGDLPIDFVPGVVANLNHRRTAGP